MTVLNRLLQRLIAARQSRAEAQLRSLGLLPAAVELPAPDRRPANDDADGHDLRAAA